MPTSTRCSHQAEAAVHSFGSKNHQLVKVSAGSAQQYTQTLLVHTQQLCNQGQAMHWHAEHLPSPPHACLPLPTCNTSAARCCRSLSATTVRRACQPLNPAWIFTTASSGAKRQGPALMVMPCCCSCAACCAWASICWYDACTPQHTGVSGHKERPL